MEGRGKKRRKLLSCKWACFIGFLGGFQYCTVCFLLRTSIIAIIGCVIISLISEIVLCEFTLLLFVTVEFPHDSRVKYWGSNCLILKENLSDGNKASIASLFHACSSPRIHLPPFPTLFTSQHVFHVFLRRLS